MSGERLLSVFLDNDGNVVMTNGDNQQVVHIETDFSHRLGPVTTANLIGANVSIQVRNALHELADLRPYKP